MSVHCALGEDAAPLHSSALPYTLMLIESLRLERHTLRDALVRAKNNCGNKKGLKRRMAVCVWVVYGLQGEGACISP